MRQNHPNRTRNQSAATQLVRQKQSGDQHVLPGFETDEVPHRPHRLNREDMQKMEPGDMSDTTGS